MEKLNNHCDIAPFPLPKRILVTLLLKSFKLLYHQFAWTYDWVAYAVSLGAWQNWVQSVLPSLDVQPTLEIGFGPGHLQVSLQRKGIRAIGIDESHPMARLAQRRMIKSGVQPNLVRGNALSLPFKNEYFHQVVMTFPPEFLFNLSTYRYL